MAAVSSALLSPIPLSPDLSRIQESLALVVSPVHGELLEDYLSFRACYPGDKLTTDISLPLWARAPVKFAFEDSSRVLRYI